MVGLLAEQNVSYSTFNILADEEVRQGKLVRDIKGTASINMLKSTPLI